MKERIKKLIAEIEERTGTLVDMEQETPITDEIDHGNFIGGIAKAYFIKMRFQNELAEIELEEQKNED